MAFPGDIHRESRNGHDIVAGCYPMVSRDRNLTIHHQAWCLKCACGTSRPGPGDMFDLNVCKATNA